MERKRDIEQEKSKTGISFFETFFEEKLLVYKNKASCANDRF